MSSLHAPPDTCLHFYRRQGAAFLLLIDFRHPIVLTYALELSAAPQKGRVQDSTRYMFLNPQCLVQTMTPAEVAASAVELPSTLVR